MKRQNYNFKLSPDEKNRFLAFSQSKGLALGTWLRALMYEAESTGNAGKSVSRELESIRLELSKIGNNINQLAKYFNQIKEPVSFHTHATQEDLLNEQLDELGKLISKTSKKLALVKPSVHRAENKKDDNTNKSN
ncbi:hypothetical protein AA103196_0005 [Ameyamaea chiangmaiensis NBRC 103196]|uniref:Plasmid mobilization relaxosome protein MobC n=1 Tax=Ameyamaea chiangmaiensis TaxID=442969 RepID=A0A850P651_9PROT|nr:plasmid mobilization relaxosome protein MobC [Ameyamaea chiangmaiensis]MBS4076035.1 plasmid mobilization relaxosome protein MobC [Ameyamaea chiangmaiensis]NVN40097.1 plasmid mobilization relaxosome protein MobC [Ameyamaea chiangmaiensis]GBQ61379.1 hypothetical protein AA103196_0005 [Ameyamaea chiangmaiensis NBRC 103196]